jgi:hypothetical protein
MGKVGIQIWKVDSTSYLDKLGTGMRNDKIQPNSYIETKVTVKKLQGLNHSC